MQANHALHAYKPLLPAVKTGQPHGLVGGKSSDFSLSAQKERLFLYESGCPDNKTEGCSFLHGLNELIHAAGQRPDLPVHLQFKKERSQLADGNVHRQGYLVDVRLPLLA